MRCCPVRQDVLNVSQITLKIQGTSPPLFIQTGLQQHSRSSFLDSAYRSLWNTIHSWWVLTGFGKFQFSAFPTARETFVNSFPSPEKFVFHTGTTESIEWLKLVSRLRIGGCFEVHFLHWELSDLLLPSHQFFCVKYCFASSPSARSPCHLGSLANFAIPVLGEGSWRYCASSRYHFCGTFRVRIMRSVLVKSSNHSSRSCDASPCSIVVFFCFLFSVSVESRNWFLPWLRVLRLRVVAGLGEESSRIESCGTHVEDVLVDELGGLVDDHRVALDVLPFLIRCVLLTTGPLIGISMIFPESLAVELLAYPRVFRILEAFPLPLNSDHSRSACALMLRNLPQIIFPLVSLRMSLVDTENPKARRMEFCPFLWDCEYF